MTNTNKTLGTTLTGANTNIIGGNNMEKQYLLTGEMINLLTEAVAFGNENKGMINKAEQFKDPKESYKRFTKTSDGFNVHNKITVAGEMAEVYEAAMEEDLDIEDADSTLVGLNAIAESIEADKEVIRKKIDQLEEDKKMREVEMSSYSERVVEAYKGYFSAFERYGAECTGIYKVTYKNNLGDVDNVMRVAFNYKNEKEFTIEFPIVTKEGLFYRRGNKYAAMYKIANKFDLLAGTTKELELVHPYTWLIDRVLEVYKDENGKSVYYSEKVFDSMVMFYRGLKNQSMNKKIDKILNNIKEYAWSDNGLSPIIFIDKGNSSVGTYSFSKNILFDFSYDELVKLGHIEGIDFLTGSTSEPAKRCKPAAGWDIVRHGAVVKLERVSKDDSAIIDYASKFKMSYPAFIKTSAKRDNSSTAKDTVNFVDGYEQQYRRKFRTSINGTDLSDSTLNKIMKTLWVAKIDLKEELPKELVDLDIFPNVNDCFLLNNHTAERMLSVFKMPGEDEMTYIAPDNGSKFIGSFRDKGSITRCLRRYIPVVEYRTGTSEEASRLIEALKQMRGEDTWYSVTPYGNIVFELDIIANPSTGRDNVAALVTQSCMEQKCILEGTEIRMTPEEVGAIDVKELVNSGDFDQRVVLYDSFENKVVYDFGYTAVMLEDFFWQPKHDNSLHAKITEVSVKYHQALDGIRIMVPTLHQAIKNSLDLKSIKEDMLLLGLTYNEYKEEKEEETIVEQQEENDLLF